CTQGQTRAHERGRSIEARARPDLVANMQSGPMRSKRPHVRNFLYRLVRRLAGAVTSTGLDAQQLWTGAKTGGLQRRNVLERMSWNDAIVSVGRGDKDGGIGHAGPDIVQRRVGEKVLKVFFDIRTA